MRMTAPRRAPGPVADAPSKSHRLESTVNVTGRPDW